MPTSTNMYHKKNNRDNKLNVNNEWKRIMNAKLLKIVGKRYFYYQHFYSSIVKGDHIKRRQDKMS